ncbi:slightly ste11-like protein [Marasmius tenuissimus]|nr:slightly ste11-like protein [Marasmius tenuissimus]
MSRRHSSNQPRGGGQFLLYRRDAVTSGAVSRTFVDLDGKLKHKTQGQISKEAAQLWRFAPEGVKLLYRGLAGLQKKGEVVGGQIGTIEDDTGALIATESDNNTSFGGIEMMLATPVEMKSIDDPFSIQKLILTPELFRTDFGAPTEMVTDMYNCPDSRSSQMSAAIPESSTKNTGDLTETNSNSGPLSCSIQAFIATNCAKPRDNSTAGVSTRQLGKSAKQAERKKSAAREAEKIPRPLNAFFLYRRDALASGAVTISIVSAEGSERRRTQPEISKDIALLWKNAPDEVRAYYNALAEAKSREHKQKYPGYKYSPKRHGKASHSGGSQAEMPRATRSNSALYPYG